MLCIGAAHAAPLQRPVDFRIDTRRSHAEFSVRLLWIHTINGRFDHLTGHVQRDDKGMASVEATIAVDSVVMSSDRARRSVMAPDFFDAARYPTIHFLSRPVPWNRLATGGALDGQLSMRGVDVPIRFELQPTLCADPMMRRCLIEARGTVSRRALGMTRRSAALSDQVQLGLLIALEPVTD